MKTYSYQDIAEILLMTLSTLMLLTGLMLLVVALVTLTSSYLFLGMWLGFGAVIPLLIITLFC